VANRVASAGFLKILVSVSKKWYQSVSVTNTAHVAQSKSNSWKRKKLYVSEGDECKSIFKFWIFIHLLNTRLLIAKSDFPLTKLSNYVPAMNWIQNQLGVFQQKWLRMGFELMPAPTSDVSECGYWFESHLQPFLVRVQRLLAYRVMWNERFKKKPYSTSNIQRSFHHFPRLLQSLGVQCK